MKKKGWGTIFIAEQDWEAIFYRTKKKKIVMYVMYVIPQISNRIFDFFWELPVNEEEIEYNSASKTSLDSDFDEEDDEFQAPLVIPQQPLIPSKQQPR